MRYNDDDDDDRGGVSGERAHTHTRVHDTTIDNTIMIYNNIIIIVISPPPPIFRRDDLDRLEFWGIALPPPINDLFKASGAGTGN